MGPTLGCSGASRRGPKRAAVVRRLGSSDAGVPVGELCLRGTSRGSEFGHLGGQPEVSENFLDGIVGVDASHKTELATTVLATADVGLINT